MSVFKTEEEKKIARALLGAAILHGIVSSNVNIPTKHQAVQSALELADEFIKQVDV